MLPLPWVVWWGRQRDMNVALEGVVEDRKHGSCWEKEEQKKGGRKSKRRGCWRQAYNTVFHQTVMLLCWLFPSSCFYCPCMYRATPNKHNQSQPTRPIPSSFPPFLSGGDYWLDLKDFFSPRLPLNQFPLLEDVFGSIRVQKPQTLPPVAGKPLQWFVCCQSALQTVTWEREKERGRDERGTLAAWKKEMEKKIYYMHIYSSSIFLSRTVSL